MNKNNFRLWMIVAVTLFAFYAAAPTFYYFAQPDEIKKDQKKVKEMMPTWLPGSYVNLGLDLQGGVQLVLGVNTDQAVENKLGRIGTSITEWSDEKSLGVKSSYSIKGEKRLRVALKEQPGDVGDLIAKIRVEFPQIRRFDQDGNKSIDFIFDESQISTIKSAALEQAQRVIRNRIDKWGVSEPLVARRSNDTVLVQLPGFSDPDKAKELLGRTAQLKFKIVDEVFNGFGSLTDLPEGVRKEKPEGTGTILVSQDKDSLLTYARKHVPEDKEVLLQRTQLQGGKVAEFRTFVVEAATELTGDDVLDASLGTDPNSPDQRPLVSLTFTGPGGKRFADITEKNTKRRMAIVLDDIVESDPQINEKISGGRASINLGGGRSYNEIIEDARELSLILKSGALPATIEVLEQREVGASLGPELASKGVKAVGLGLLAVLIYMMIYYRRPGFVACVALVLNGLFLIALMAGFGFALTLPGIAGFILTLGMAVDANVLINERIRQELQDGRNARKAIENGFDKVFWTIMDANVTTLIAAIVLLETNSSGPIRGFAITLMLGLLVSMFTSLFCTRVFFTRIVAKFKSDGEIRKWFSDRPLKKWNLNFLKLSPAFSLGGIVLMVVVIGSFFVKGGLNWSVDFAGGTEMEVGFAQDVNPEELRDIGRGVGIKHFDLQQLDNSAKKYAMRFDRLKDADAQVTAGKDKLAIDFQSAIREKLASYKPEILRVDSVGPKVGKSLRTEGFKSAFLAILFVLIYIFLRFDMRFGPGAVAKMVVDVFVILAFYLFAWVSFDLTSVAALLTVIGYSVNDTIVIYDRIRENLSTFPKRNLRENINAALNDTFSRTINTSVTTFLAIVGILVFGTSQIRNFATAMGIGVVAATLSSIFISSYLIIYLEKWRKMRNAKALQAK